MTTPSGQDSSCDGWTLQLVFQVTSTSHTLTVPLPCHAPPSAPLLAGCVQASDHNYCIIVTSLLAEKHAKVPCVTVSVDDITFDSIVSVGHVVILRAVVNRPFSSSLEARDPDCSYRFLLPTS